eukprot:CCRYP_006071-RA/>CCRYP_006071-RA protein AED:0.46 eAED:0.73 QI:0/0/0.5/1/0/0/2/193/95
MLISASSARTAVLAFALSRSASAESFSIAFSVFGFSMISNDSSSPIMGRKTASIVNIFGLFASAWMMIKIDSSFKSNVAFLIVGRQEIARTYAAR